MLHYSKLIDTENLTLFLEYYKAGVTN